MERPKTFIGHLHPDLLFFGSFLVIVIRQSVEPTLPGFQKGGGICGYAHHSVHSCTHIYPTLPVCEVCVSLLSISLV